tara:strand:+ start:655 stop:1113 length:459 start_codon:yes stop_codon:yes gene_type:complete
MAKNKKSVNFSMGDYFTYYYLSLNNNKFFAGIIMLIMNIGAKYASIEFSKTQEQYLKNVFSKQLIIFATAWVATHDIIISILLTAAFVILSDFLINPESQLCILPKKYKAMHTILESESDIMISNDEVKKAKETIEKAKKQQQRINFMEQML